MYTELLETIDSMDDLLFYGIHDKWRQYVLWHSGLLRIGKKQRQTHCGNAYETVEKIVPLNLENKTKMSIIILKAVNWNTMVVFQYRKLLKLYVLWIGERNTSFQLIFNIIFILSFFDVGRWFEK